MDIIYPSNVVPDKAQYLNREHLCFSGLTSDGYLCADGQPPGSRDYEEHQYVNTQSLENLDVLAQGPNGHRGSRAPESPKKDLFDMSKSSLFRDTF